MSRSGYSDDLDNWALIRWRGAVSKATKGKRGQQFFRDLLAALDAMPNKRLIAHAFERDGEVCAIAALGRQRGIDMSEWDPEDCDDDRPAQAMNIAPALVREVENMNDDYHDTPEQRWVRVRAWVAAQITSPQGAGG